MENSHHTPVRARRVELADIAASAPRGTRQAPKECEMRAVVRRFLEQEEGQKELPERLAECIARQVSATMARRRALSRGVDADDVAQVVLSRFVQKAPTHPLADTDPLARLLAWVNTVTVRHLMDLKRKRQEELEREPGRHAGGLVALGAERRLEASSELRMVWSVIAARYPKGLQLLDALSLDPEASSLELAARLGTSAANVNTMRARMRRVLLRERTGSRRRASGRSLALATVSSIR